MTRREAAALAEKLWSHPGMAIGIIWRRQKKPRFLVGVTVPSRAEPVTFGKSNVDW